MLLSDSHKRHNVDIMFLVCCVLLLLMEREGRSNQPRGDFGRAAIVLVSVCLLRSHLYAASASQPLKSTHLGWWAAQVWGFNMILVTVIHLSVVTLAWMWWWRSGLPSVWAAFYSTAFHRSGYEGRGKVFCNPSSLFREGGKMLLPTTLCLKRSGSLKNAAFRGFCC